MVGAVDVLPIIRGEFHCLAIAFRWRVLMERVVLVVDRYEDLRSLMNLASIEQYALLY